MNIPKNIAPIALFTYNRPWHTRQTVEALAANDLALDSNLFVFSDAPRFETQNTAVQEVRDFIHTVRGFRSVTLIERDVNYGLARSIIDGVTTLVREHGRIIVLEDDLITSTHFLRYMNDALELYANNDQVISVHGYLFPISVTTPETFFIRGADCWGWATWKRGWDLFQEDGATLMRKIKSRRLTRAFNFSGSYNYFKMLERQVRGENESWAIRWYASAMIHNKLTLYPGRSLVCNIGNDASGTHCGVSNRFDVIISQTPVQVIDILVEENIKMRRAFESFFQSMKQPFAKKLLNSFRKLLVKLSLTLP